MKYGFVKVGAFTPKIKVADTIFNQNAIIEGVKQAHENGVEVLTFPELCITGYTCADLFFSPVLLDGAKKSLSEIASKTSEYNVLFFVGLPFKHNGQIYNTVAGVCKGKVLGIVPKTYLIDNYSKNESRYFATPSNEITTTEFFGDQIDFGANLIFTNTENAEISVGVCVGGDAFAPLSTITTLSLNGANVIVNPLSGACVVGGKEYCHKMFKALSSSALTGIVYAHSGEGESTTDSVAGGDRGVFELGSLVKDDKLFTTGLTVSEIDLTYINSERAKATSTFNFNREGKSVSYTLENKQLDLTRVFKKTPFVPNLNEVDNRAELILDIQAEGLKKRIEHVNAKSLVLGLSGGLDSTLAIIVCVKALKKLNRSTKDILAVTMPCFGTSSRTYQNTLKLAKALGVTLKKVDISKSVTRHLKDIGHDLTTLDVTFENAQARERTQVIMDIANMNGGLVIGTGDLSEVALGWSTYNGDHMSMYGVNCSIPKTLVRHLVTYFANTSRGKLKATLLDILDTPVSPELLPTENGEIAQKTEDIVGPYILHDFFLYQFIRKGYTPDKIYFVACHTFKGDFKRETILKWLKIFFRRFFAQQFKRSCVPDGIKVGSVALSPRTDFKMPSDAVASLWLNSLENP